MVENPTPLIYQMYFCEVEYLQSSGVILVPNSVEKFAKGWIRWVCKWEKVAVLRRTGIIMKYGMIEIQLKVSSWRRKIHKNWTKVPNGTW